MTKKVKPSKVEGLTFPAKDATECAICGAPLKGTSQRRHSAEYHRKGYAGPSYTPSGTWKVPAMEAGQSAIYVTSEDEARVLWASQQYHARPGKGGKRGLEGL